jgi:hypothetical protein
MKKSEWVNSRSSSVFFDGAEEEFFEAFESDIAFIVVTPSCLLVSHAEPVERERVANRCKFEMLNYTEG